MSGTTRYLLSALWYSVFAVIYTATVDPVYAATTTLHEFSAKTGFDARGGLMRASDGNYYGATEHGGRFNRGVVYRLTPSGVATALHDFDGPLGSGPNGGLVEGLPGVLFGTTREGGTSGVGTAFRLSFDGTFSVVRHFVQASGATPWAGMIKASDGDLYGTLFTGGAGDRGGVYTLRPSDGTLTINAFTAPAPAPSTRLLQTDDGSFYGASVNGGTGAGAVFRVAPDGTVSVVHTFNGLDGAFPESGLTIGDDGRLYGTAIGNGIGFLGGTIYAIGPNDTFQLVHGFDGTNGTPFGVNELVARPDGFLYAAAGGGTDNHGIVLRIATNGAVTTIGELDGVTGDRPASGPVAFDDSGAILGTSLHGGNATVRGPNPTALGLGTIFRMTLTGQVTRLHAFEFKEGASPADTLLLARDGRLLGNATSSTASLGTVFAVNLDGSFGVVHAFDGNDGAYPIGNLTQASDGSILGATLMSSSGVSGALFRIDPQDQLTTLHEFTAAEGFYPVGGLLERSDGSFIGLNRFGGAGNVGTIFRLTRNGVLTTLRELSIGDGDPQSGLTMGPDGAAYGVMAGGGDGGLIYRISASNQFSVLYRFAEINGNSAEYPKGATPMSRLTLGRDGALYGTASGGGNAQRGTVFKVTPTGIVTLVHQFAGPDGAGPIGELLSGSDGNFYGTTAGGGQFQSGTVFRMTPAGQVTTLHSFSGDDGSAPFAGVVQGRDGRLYGTTTTGGTAQAGVLFVLDGPPLIPTGVQADPGNGEISLSWSAAGGALTYEVLASSEPAGANPIVLQTGLTTTSTRLTGLTNGRAYQIGVRSVGASGSSLVSSAITATPTSPDTGSGGGGGGGGGSIGLMLLCAFLLLASTRALHQLVLKSRSSR
jgi:uncharacterized repeat protein (TIGR03803 family)